MPSPPTSPKVKGRQTFPLPPTRRLGSCGIKSTSLDHELFLGHAVRVRSMVKNGHRSSLQGSCPLEWSRRNPTGQGQGQASKTSPLTDWGSAKRTTLKPSGQQVNYQECRASILNQGKSLCAQYIRSRLRRAGLLNRKALQRMRNSLESNCDEVYSVFPLLNTLGEELERMYPRIYSNVSRQLSRLPFGELADGNMAPMLLNVVAKELFAQRRQQRQGPFSSKDGVTWSKIVSLFAICGGFAVDCVRQDHYDYLPRLVDSIGEVIEEDLMQWLLDHGGWPGLRLHLRSPELKLQMSIICWLTVFITLSTGAYAFLSILGRLSNVFYGRVT